MKLGTREVFDYAGRCDRYLENAFLGKLQPALDSLFALEQARWSPGVLSLLVALLQALEKPDAALQLLSEAIEHYKRINVHMAPVFVQ